RRLPGRHARGVRARVPAREPPPARARGRGAARAGAPFGLGVARDAAALLRTVDTIGSPIDGVGMRALAGGAQRGAVASCTALGGPLGLLAVGALGSEIANPHRFGSVETYAVKELTFLASFLLVVYVIVSVARSEHNVHTFVRLLVGGGTFVATSVILESRT